MHFTLFIFLRATVHWAKISIFVVVVQLAVLIIMRSCSEVSEREYGIVREKTDGRTTTQSK